MWKTPEGNRFAAPNVAGPRIAVAELPESVVPARSPFRYPKYAADWGIEQDFLRFLTQEYPLYVKSVSEADLVYIPVFWTRIHVKNNYGTSGVRQLQEIVDPVVRMDSEKFTVCQYDDGPLVDLGNSTIFLASRKTDRGRDVPLLASPLPRQRILRPPRARDIRASFAGRLGTHPVRQELFQALQDDPRVDFTQDLRPKRYARLLARTKIVLAPRGYGGSSFRFFEALQMGAVPWLIGDVDVRPFKDQIDWESISYYSPTVDEFLDEYTEVSDAQIDEKLRSVSRSSEAPWTLGAWCWYLIRELAQVAR